MAEHGGGAGSAMRGRGRYHVTGQWINADGLGLRIVGVSLIAVGHREDRVGSRHGGGLRCVEEARAPPQLRAVPRGGGGEVAGAMWSDWSDRWREIEDILQLLDLDLTEKTLD